MLSHDRNRISLLHHLIALCREGQEGYRIASHEVSEPDLRYLLSSYSLQRTKFAAELEENVSRSSPLAELPEGLEPSRPGWFDLGAILAERDDRRILESCLRGEEETLVAYRHAEAADLPNAVRPIIRSQLGQIAMACARISKLVSISGEIS